MAFEHLVTLLSSFYSERQKLSCSHQIWSFQMIMLLSVTHVLSIFAQDINKDDAVCNTMNLALHRFNYQTNVFGNRMDQLCFCDDNELWRPVCNRVNARTVSNRFGQQDQIRADNTFSSFFPYFAQAVIAHEMVYSEELFETMEEAANTACTNTPASSITVENNTACLTRANKVLNEMHTELESLLRVAIPESDFWRSMDYINGSNSTAKLYLDVLPSDYDLSITGKICNISLPTIISASQCFALNKVTTSSNTIPKRFRNAVTPEIDGSIHYGGDDSDRPDLIRKVDLNGVLQCELLTLDDQFGGKMMPNRKDIAAHHHGKNMNGKVRSSACLEMNNEANFQPDDELIVGGDVRSSQNVPLMAIETLLVREHNRWCGELASSVPDPQQRYERVKHIMKSIQQNIIYYEYLPLLLGNDAIPSYSKYNSSCSTSVSTWFDTVGFRFAHTQIPEYFPRVNTNYQCSTAQQQIFINSTYLAPNLYKQLGTDNILAGLMTGHAEAVDRHIVDGLRNFLFSPIHQDLFVLDIVRARERGLCDYNTARKVFGLNAVKSFEDITDEINTANILKEIYGVVDAIDPIVGGLAEKKYNGSIVGELFYRILLDQFIRSRDCDVNYFENGNNPANQWMTQNSSLFHRIRATRASDIIRRNTNIRCVPDDVFKLPSTFNPLKSSDGTVCTSLMNVVNAGPNMCKPSQHPLSSDSNSANNLRIMIAVPVVVIGLLISCVFCFFYRRKKGGQIRFSKAVDEKPENDEHEAELQLTIPK